VCESEGLSARRAGFHFNVSAFFSAVVLVLVRLPVVLVFLAPTDGGDRYQKLVYVNIVVPWKKEGVMPIWKRSCVPAFWLSNVSDVDTGVSVTFNLLQ